MLQDPLLARMLTDAHEASGGAIALAETYLEAQAKRDGTRAAFALRLFASIRGAMPTADRFSVNGCSVFAYRAETAVEPPLDPRITKHTIRARGKAPRYAWTVEGSKRQHRTRAAAERALSC